MARRKKARTQSHLENVAMAMHGAGAAKQRMDWSNLFGSAKMGWRKMALVSITASAAPTEAMIDAGMNAGADNRQHAEDIYRAMVEAAIEKYDDS